MSRTLATAVLSLLALTVGGSASAEQTAEQSDGPGPEQAAEQPDEQAQRTAHAPPRTESGLRADTWSAPQGANVELAAYIASQSWQTTYGGRDLNFTAGLSAGWLVTEWMELQVIADWSRRSFSPADLRVSNTSTFLGVGPVFSLWLDFLRLHVDAAGGGMLRTVSYGNTDITGNSARMSAAWQVGGGLAVSMWGRLGVGATVLRRAHDDRSSFLFLFDVSCFF